MPNNRVVFSTISFDLCQSQQLIGKIPDAATAERIKTALRNP
jgi:hypothetical protein